MRVCADRCPAEQNAVDGPTMHREWMRDSGCFMQCRERIDESGARQRSGGITLTEVKVEITGYEHGDIGSITIRMLQNLSQLGMSEIVAALTFTMQVVGGHAFAGDEDIA
jgi:hypothetical protein